MYVLGLVSVAADYACDADHFGRGAADTIMLTRSRVSSSGGGHLRTSLPPPGLYGGTSLGSSVDFFSSSPASTSSSSSSSLAAAVSKCIGEQDQDGSDVKDDAEDDVQVAFGCHSKDLKVTWTRSGRGRRCHKDKLNQGTVHYIHYVFYMA